ncbi:MAG: hypothetical protein JJE13_03840 [Thermoleophilia bacterium]|nr:hypothetical protein [Thermoleophilia bacterium]
MAPIALGLLFIATVAAFGWSQRLKREPLVIDRVSFVAIGAEKHKPSVITPNGDCRRDEIAINFRTTRTDVASVEIIGPNGGTVRLLEGNRFFKRYREHVLYWDGKKDNGRVPKTERYRVRITMKELDRVLYLPGLIRLRKVPAEKSACVEIPMKRNSTVGES